MEIKKHDHEKAQHSEILNGSNEHWQCRSQLNEMNWILSVQTTYCILLRTWKTKKEQHCFHGQEGYSKYTGYNNCIQVTNDGTISIRLCMVVQIYVPNTDGEEKEINRFYGQVQSEINKACKQDKLLGIGDWNAKEKCSWTIESTVMKNNVLSIYVHPIISSLLNQTSNNQNDSYIMDVPRWAYRNQNDYVIGVRSGKA